MPLVEFRHGETCQTPTDAHPERKGTKGDRPADAAHSDQAQRLAPYRCDERTIPSPGMNHPIVGDDAPDQSQEQGHRLLGDTFLVGSRCNRHGDLVRRRGRQVNQVVADAGPGNRSKTRSDREEIGRHALATGKHRIELGKVGTNLCGGQREITNRVDQLEAGIGQYLPESAGLVAK